MVDNSEKVAKIMVDAFTAIEAACVNAKRQIVEVFLAEKPQEMAPKESVGLTWNPANIKWETAEGSSGPYERSEDVNSQDFKEMLKDLAAHSGKLTKERKFYWTFQNGVTVGRKASKW